MKWRSWFWLLLVLAACTREAAVTPAEQLRTVALEGVQALACLDGTVEVLVTAAGEPHIYGENENDVACAMGFVVARDRYFEMEMAARLALGRLSEIFGELGLATDIENRTLGMAEAAQRFLDAASPMWRARMEAYAAGVNEYVQRVHADELPAPSEFGSAVLRGLGGFSHAAAMV